MQTIHAPVDLDPFQSFSNSTNSLNLNQKTLVYLGSVSDTSWHSPSYLARAYRLFKDRFHSTSLLIVTSSNHSILRSLLLKAGVPENELVLVFAKTISEVSGYLKQADYACLPFREIRHHHDLAIAQTMISTKFTEYVAAGLPVLCNQTIGGASALITKYSAGTVVNLDKSSIPNEKYSWVDKSSDEDFSNRVSLLSGLFSIETVTEQYLDAYSLCKLAILKQS